MQVSVGTQSPEPQLTPNQPNHAVVSEGRCTYYTNPTPHNRTPLLPAMPPVPLPLYAQPIPVNFTCDRCGFVAQEAEMAVHRQKPEIYCHSVNSLTYTSCAHSHNHSGLPSYLLRCDGFCPPTCSFAMQNTVRPQLNLQYRHKPTNTQLQRY